MAEALDAAHRAGLVHRDVKPANVLLAGDGRVKVADFGIAKAAEGADLTQPGLMVGTAKYLAPEQVEGKPVDPRTDIYTLGVVLYEMLCGRPPFEGDSEAAIALARLQREPLRPRQVRPSVPKPLEDVVCRAMAREPADRYDSAADLRAALLAAGAAPSADLDADLAATEPRRGADHPAAAPARRRARSARRRAGAVVPADRAELAGPHRDPRGDRASPSAIAGLLFGRSGAGDLLGGVARRHHRRARSRRDRAQRRRRRSTRLASAASAPGASAAATTRRTTTRLAGHRRRPRTPRGPPRATTTATSPCSSPASASCSPPAQRGELDELVAHQPDQRLVGVRSTWPTATPARSRAGASRSRRSRASRPAPASTVDLGGTDGGAVLIWITDQGDGTGGDEVTIAEAVLTGVPE